MAKHAFPSNDALCHAWAHQTSDHGHSKSMSFRGPVLYSYSTAIAYLTTRRTGGDLADIAGDRVALVETRSYSITTSSKHYPAMRASLANYRTIYLPGDVSIPNHAEAFSEEDVVARVVREWGESVRRGFHEAEHGRDYIARVKAYRAAVDSWNRLERMTSLYRMRHGVVIPSLPRIDDDLARIDARERRLEETRAERQQRNAARMDEYYRLKFAKHEERVAAFIEGKNTGAIYGGLDYLRVKGGDVETSKGARVPLDHVRRIAPRLLRMLREGSEWHRNGESIRVGHFQIDEVRSDGTVRAGCHTFDRSEIERFAAVIGIEEPSHV